MDAFAGLLRLHFSLDGRSYPVLALEGREALSEIFRFEIEVLAPAGPGPAIRVGSEGRLEFAPGHSQPRSVAGVLTAWEQTGRHTDGRLRIRCTLESTLARLRLRTDTRLVLHRRLDEILLKTLQRNGITSDRVRLHLTRPCPTRPWTLQVQESDYDFLARLLARAGLFFWSEADDTGEVIHIADHNGALAMQGRSLRFLPAAGMEGDGENLVRQLELTENLLPAELRVQALHPDTPELRQPARLRSPAAESAPAILQNHFATGASTLGESEAEARVRLERAAVEAWGLHARGEAEAPFPGRVVPLDASRFDPACSGDMLPVEVTHRGSQYAGLGVAGEDAPYGWEARFIRRETPFRPALPPRPDIPFTFCARVESAGPYPHLDEQGRYRLRAEFDRSGALHTEASGPVRRLAPFGSPPGELPSGWHTPLGDGAEVLLSCLSGDPDQPMIVGALPDAHRPGPVTAANATQNILRTAAGNELCLDDRRDQEAITLGTWGGQNILRLDAAALGHRLRLATERGDMRWEAKKTMATKSGETLTEQVGEDRTQSVEGTHRTETRTAEIHHQAATDLRHRAAKNLRLDAGGNLEASCGQRLRIDAGQNARVTVRTADAVIAVRNGALHLHAAGDLHLRGQGGGDIVFSQGGGGFAVRADGTVALFGNKVTLGGQAGVAFNGAVDFRMGAPAPAPEANPLPSLELTSFSRLKANEENPDLQDLQINLHDFYDNQLPGHFAALTGLKWRLLSDCGEERTGVVDGPTISIRALRIKETVEFEIENLELLDREPQS